MVEVTEWAVEVLGRAADAATRLNPDAKLRLSQRNGTLEASLAEGPADGDDEIVVGERVMFVAGDVDGLVDVESPHDRLILKPPGAEPNERPET